MYLTQCLIAILDLLPVTICRYTMWSVHYHTASEVCYQVVLGARMTTFELTACCAFLHAAHAQGRAWRIQSDKISHIDMGDDHIDTVISHIISPCSISISRMMTVSIYHIQYRYAIFHIDVSIDIRLMSDIPHRCPHHILSLCL